MDARQDYRTVGPMASGNQLKKTQSTFSRDKVIDRADQIRRDDDIVKTKKRKKGGTGVGAKIKEVIARKKKKRADRNNAPNKSLNSFILPSSR